MKTNSNQPSKPAIPPEPEYVDIDGETPVIENHDAPAELATVKPSNFEGMAFANPDDIPDLDSAEEGVNVAPQYMEFATLGETVRAVYNGLTTITSSKNNTTRQIPTAVYQNRKGIWINSGANLVNQLRNLKPGTLVSIKYLGKEKTGSGNEIKKFEVHILKLNLVKPEDKPPF